MYHSVIMLIMHCLVGCASKKSSVPSLLEEEQKVEELFWMPYRSLSMNEYDARPQIIYVTADWCLTCVQFEQDTLFHPSIQKVLIQENFAAFRADWTQNDPDVSSLMEHYQERILPFVVIVKDGKSVLVKEHIQRGELEKLIVD